MPFNFAKYEHYSINFTELFKEINSKKILDDVNVQTEYLKLWKKVLVEHDAALTNQLASPRSILDLQLKLHSEPEIFQIPMNYKNTKVFLHFRVSIANKVIENEKSKGQRIPLDEFLRKDGTIKWTPVERSVDLHSILNSNDPIIIVPFLSNQYNFLVIDGNHRLTYKAQNNIDEIYSLIISEQSVIDFSIFSSSFDKLYYIMHNEINHMANATHYQKLNAMQVVQKSYLTDGNFKFL